MASASDTATNNESMSRRPIIVIALLSILLHFLWSIMDANATLFAYDFYLTKFHSTRSPALSSMNENAMDLGRNSIDDDRQRRIFHHHQRINENVEGKVIWVTGASSGIGAELSIQLAGAGTGHLILSGRNREKLESVAQSCKQISQWRQNALSKSGHFTKNMDMPKMKISIIPFDMSSNDPTIINNAISSAIQQASPSGIDILILNAGQYQLYPALETPHLSTSLSHLMQVNFHSPVQLAQQLIQTNQWKERHYGHLVIINSLMGKGPAALNAAYVATKHAARGYFQTLAAEEGEWLRVDVVCPGATDTGLWKGSLQLVDNHQDEEKQNQNNSVNRTEQEKWEITADDRSKMSVVRCAQLILSSILGPNILFFETYITKNPGLLWVYLASHEPTLFRILNHYIIAPLRVGLWRRDGSDPLYLPTLARYWMEIIWESVVSWLR